MTLRPVTVPAAVATQLPTVRLLSDGGRSMRTLVLATRGAGKSRLLGRVVALQDFLRGVPLVVLDPIGGLIDNFLDSITRLSPERQTQLWPRVRYVNMAGQDGMVTPWPIYAKAQSDEQLYTTSQRFVDVLRRADPQLASASIQGMNRLAPLATAAGIVLSALGLGITEADSLLTDPVGWSDRLIAVTDRYPDAIEAVNELQRLTRLSAREHELRIEPLKNKLAMFRFAPNFRAIFGAATPGVIWPDVFDRRIAVLIDFRHISDLAAKKFCLLWVFHSLVTFIKARGHGRHLPLSFMIDEVSYLIGSASAATDVLNADLDELINRIARSHAVWLTIAGQEQHQLPEPIRNTLLSLGNVIFGRTSDPDAAERLARRYYPYDPYLVKKAEAIVGRLRDARVPMYGIVGQRTSEFTKDEQIQLNSRVFLNLPTFHFMVGASRAEGMLPSALTRISIARIDHGRFVNEPLVAETRSLLTRRDGVSQAAILDEIDNRQQINSGHTEPTPIRGQAMSRRSPRRAS